MKKLRPTYFIVLHFLTSTQFSKCNLYFHQWRCVGSPSEKWIISRKSANCLTFLCRQTVCIKWTWEHTCLALRPFNSSALAAMQLGSTLHILKEGWSPTMVLGTDSEHYGPTGCGRAERERLQSNFPWLRTVRTVGDRESVFVQRTTTGGSSPVLLGK
jgi:hypothetical protein